VQILLTGGSGLLGTELANLGIAMVAPTRAELDVSDAAAIAAKIAELAPDLIIHAAAATNNRKIENDATAALTTNIVGTALLAAACLGTRIRLVYLSTDYVYKGDSGNYAECDELCPSNLYAWSKLAGEASVRAVPNHLIIRTSFGRAKFDYPGAFTDKWSSKEYVDIIAPEILEAAMSPLTGTINIGGPKRTLYEYAQERNPNVKPIERNQSEHESPADTSLDLSRWTDYKAGNDIVRGVKECRICRSEDLVKYLDLGMLPLANNLATTASDAKAMQRFPMQVLYCRECSLSQLSVVVDPRVLFSHYTYRSSVNKGYVSHCRSMAESTGKLLDLSSGDLVVDIAGNDGALLSEFRELLNVDVLNVDPAENISAIAESRGVPTLNEFWSADVAQEIVEKHKKPKLITATNVFAHVDNVHGFFEAARACIRPDGALMLEFPYGVDFIEHSEFDTIYFEHLSYVLIRPVMHLAEQTDLEVFDVSKQDIHGGSVRVFLGHPGMHSIDPSVEQFMKSEEAGGYHDDARYLAWSRDIEDLVADLKRELALLKQSGAKIAAFAASAKGNTLLNSCGLNANTIDYIVDDTPEKIGHYSPGNGIAIVDRSVLDSDPPDYLVVLAWNFAKEIIASTSEYHEKGGKYILPIPFFRVVD